MAVDASQRMVELAVQPGVEAVKAEACGSCRSLMPRSTASWRTSSFT